MSNLNLTELTSGLLIDSFDELGQRLDPASGANYCAKCNVPDVQIPATAKQRIQEAKTAHKAEKYAEALEKGADAYALTKAQLSESPGAPSNAAQLELTLQRIWFPALLKVLRKRYEKSSGTLRTVFKILYFLLVALLMWDERMQEWMTEESSPERIASLAATGFKRWFAARDASNPQKTQLRAEIPYIIVDVIGLVAYFMRNKLARGINRQSKFWVAYGWESVAPVQFPISEAIAERTLSMWWEIFPELKIQASNYEITPPAESGIKFLGITLVPLLKNQGGPMVIPVLHAVPSGIYKLSENWALNLSDVPSFPATSGALSLALRRTQAKKKETIGSSKAKKGLEFSFDAIEVIAKARFDANNEQQNDLGIVFRLKQAKLVLLSNAGNESKGDSKLLKRALPNGFNGQVDLGLGLSTKSGFYWEGGLGLEVYAPVAWDVTPVQGISVEVSYVQFLLNAQSSNASTYAGLEGRLGLKLTLGPMTLLAGGLGASLKLAYQSSGQGNLGGFDVDFSLLEPTSFGLKVDAKIMQGGGFMARDVQRDRWFGAFALSLNFWGNWSLSGIVLSEGDSVLGILWAQELGIPFLNGQIEGIGLLVGCDRRGDREAFLQGMRTGALDAILFPADPVGQAPQIAATLSQLLPVDRDRTIVGLMVQWVFGKAARLVVIEFGFLLEFDGDDLAHIYLIGQGTIRAKKLPENIFLINLELFGDLDFETNQYFIKLVLRNSKLAGGDLTGDGLIYFDGDGRFILSVGGFNPRYLVPQGSLFELARLNVSLANRDNLKLIFQAYVALTHDSFQIGGKLSILASAAGFSLEGLLSLDILVRFNLEFFVDVALSVAIKRGSRTLASVSFEGTLSGISTWRLSGKARLSLLFFSISIPVSFTFGSSAPAEFESVDGLQVLQQALKAPENWVATRTDLGVVLSQTPRSGVWFAAHSSLRVSQTVVPLEQTITRIGPSPLIQPKQYRIVSATFGTGSSSAIDSVQAQFAPGLFWDVDLDEALRSPTFELMKSGCEFKNAGMNFGEIVSADMDYEIIQPIDDAKAPTAPIQPSTIQTLDASLITMTTQISEKAFYRSSIQPVEILPRRYAVADTNLRSASLPNQATTQLTYFQARELRIKTKTQRLHVVSNYELAST